MASKTVIYIVECGPAKTCMCAMAPPPKQSHYGIEDQNNGVFTNNTLNLQIVEDFLSEIEGTSPPKLGAPALAFVNILKGFRGTAVFGFKQLIKIRYIVIAHRVGYFCHVGPITFG